MPEWEEQEMGIHTLADHKATEQQNMQAALLRKPHSTAIAQAW